MLSYFSCKFDYDELLKELCPSFHIKNDIT